MSSGVDTPAMGWQALVASVIRSLAWPVSIVVLALIFRSPVTHLLWERLSSLEAFGARATFGKRLEESRPIVEATGQKVGAVDPPSEDEQRRADAEPVGLVLTAAGELEQALSALLEERGVEAPPIGLRQLAGLALGREVISQVNYDAIDGLAAMRNLAAHGGAGRVTSEEALEYVAMVDAVLYSLRTKPR